MTETIQYTVALILLILFSAYFSATETAFSSLSRTRLKTLAEKGSRRAALALSLSDNYDRLISTILIGNNVVNIAAASIGTVLFVGLYGDIGATVSTVVLTVLVLIFGEVTPKSIAKDNPERFSMFSAPFIRVLIWIFKPLNYLFGLWKKMISRLLRIEKGGRMSQEELLMLVDEVQQGGSIDKEEGSLLKNAISFSERRAEDILTHRVDLEAVDIDSSKEEVAKVFTESKFSRLPVYEESIDNIVGIVNQKDFYSGTGITSKSLREIMTAPLFVLKTERIDELFRLLKENKSHIAVVLDEYGGTFGIVTMEDILEELVGEIYDEHDEVTEEIRQLSEGVYLVDCLINLDDFLRFFGLSSDSESISLGGWVMECLGKVPEVGDSFTYQKVTAEVAETDGQRVAFLKVTKQEEEPEEEPGEQE